MGVGKDGPGETVSEGAEVENVGVEWGGGGGDWMW